MSNSPRNSRLPLDRTCCSNGPVNIDLGIWSKLTRVVFFLLAVAGILGVLVWYQPLIQSNENLRKKNHQLETLVRKDDLENRRLEGLIKQLQQNPKAVERVAREKLNLAKPGETIIRFEESPSPASPSSTFKPFAPGKPAPGTVSP
ncbi:MAG: septum formation initiator family protein [Pedosphaera sp.]|nr:septum formation initiator family protein [Pedosphaera sp.]